MIKTLKERKNAPTPYFVSQDEPFTPVVNRLAVTPSEMAQMTSRGIPITPANESLFYDGDDAISPSVALENRRGIDVVDVWNAEKDAKQKLSQARVNDIAKYGE